MLINVTAFTETQVMGVPGGGLCAALPAQIPSGNTVASISLLPCGMPDQDRFGPVLPVWHLSCSGGDPTVETRGRPRGPPRGRPAGTASAAVE